MHVIVCSLLQTDSDDSGSLFPPSGEETEGSETEKEGQGAGSGESGSSSSGEEGSSTESSEGEEKTGGGLVSANIKYLSINKWLNLVNKIVHLIN